MQERSRHDQQMAQMMICRTLRTITGVTCDPAGKDLHVDERARLRAT